MIEKPTSGVITVNNEKEIIQIHDHYRWRLPILRFFFICWATSGLLGLYNLSAGHDFQVRDGVDLVLSLAAIPVLVFLITQKTALTKIPFDRITKIQKKTFFGSGRVQIHLKNGKTRDIFKSMSKQDLDFLFELAKYNTTGMTAEEQTTISS